MYSALNGPIPLTILIQFPNASGSVKNQSPPAANPTGLEVDYSSNLSHNQFSDYKQPQRSTLKASVKVNQKINIMYISTESQKNNSINLKYGSV